MRLLGVDFGLKKVGLALAEAGLPQPLEVVSNKKALAKIIQLAGLYQADKIVVGLPSGPIKKEVAKFVAQLQLLTELPIELQDETLTSQEALAKMRESNKKKKERAQKEDAWAAACLLQAYLEKGGHYV